MIIAGLISAAAGIGEFLLLYICIKCVTSHRIIPGILFGLIKTAIYITGFIILMKAAAAVLKISLILFGAGFFICMAVYTAKKFFGSITGT